MSRARSEGAGGFWQSFADLAMGLMAVFALVLVLLLWAQSRQNAELREDREQLRVQRDEVTQQRDALARERSRFAVELVGLLDVAEQIIRDQDGAEDWLRALFREADCLLDLGEDGALRRISLANAEGSQAADLYPLGETRMDPAGEQALRSCRQNFLRLAYCLSPDSRPGEGQEERILRCGAQLDGAGLTETDARVVEGLRQGLEALVLQGNTDRMPVTSRRMDAVAAVGSAPVDLSELADAFVGNAHLGAERARQALGHLLGLVQEHDADERDALQVLMSRVRVESPSFGRYQVGPPEWREAACADEDSCEAARNLSLRLRWRKDELRRPFRTIQTRLCSLLADPESALSRGLESLRSSPEDQSEALKGLKDVEGRPRELPLDPGELRRRFGCPDEGAP